MGDVYNWSTVLRTEYNVINDNCGAHRVNSLRVDVIVPLRGTCGEMGGLLYPTAALLRSLQWVSDGRSRVAEPMGEMGGWLIPTAALLRSLQWVSDSRSRVAEPMGDMGGLLIPTAALLRSLQWVSDGRSRYAEPMGRWEVCYAPQRRCFAACSGFQIVGPASRNLWGDGRMAFTHSGAASQLAVGFGWSVPLCGTCGVRWEMAMSYVRCTVPCVDALWHA